MRNMNRLVVELTLKLCLEAVILEESGCRRKPLFSDLQRRCFKVPVTEATIWASSLPNSQTDSRSRGQAIYKIRRRISHEKTVFGRWFDGGFHAFGCGRQRPEGRLCRHLGFGQREEPGPFPA